MIKFILNNQSIETNQPVGTTVLDFVRYHQHLKGTKIGCREGDCGACTLLVGDLKDTQLHYQSMTSCLMPLSNAHGKHIVSIEGLNMDQLSPIQKAIVEEGGTQCGFCTVGFAVSLSGFMLTQKTINYQNAIAAIDGNICRCTGYKSLERAAKKITEILMQRDHQKPIDWLVKHHFLPDYFATIEARLKSLQTSLSTNGKTTNTAIIVGGGTDLFVQRPEEMAKASIAPFYDQYHLKKVEEKSDHIHIGASATASDIMDSSIMQTCFPDLDQYMKLVSSTPIRNMGTIAGNLVNASPIGDLTIFFLALNSMIVLNKNGKKRKLPLNKFYLGYKTLDKSEDEFVEEIFFKRPSKDSFFNFEKVCKRTHLDIATVNTACLLEIKGNVIQHAHLSAGGVGPIPTYLSKSSAALIGKKVNIDLLKEVVTIIQEEISPISDARGSKAYKQLLIRQLFFAHFFKFFPQQLSISQLIA